MHAKGNGRESSVLFIDSISDQPKTHLLAVNRPFPSYILHGVSSMADRPSTSIQPSSLRLACGCASATTPPADPWASLVQQGKLRDGTKERILNALHDAPSTIAQLAARLDLSQPTIHRHITDLLVSELIREESVPEDERMWAVERYYRPNFPVIDSTDRAAVSLLLDELSDAFAVAFQRSLPSLRMALAQTRPPEGEDERDAVLHYLYTTTARLGRAKLERAGALPAWPAHRDGSRWLWWAEEPFTEEDA
jgi:DNA-binding transcriptional ArsR family regulator